MACGEDPGGVPFVLSHYAFVSHAAYEKKGVLVLCVLQREISLSLLFMTCFEIEP